MWRGVVGTVVTRGTTETDVPVVGVVKPGTDRRPGTPIGVVVLLRDGGSDVEVARRRVVVVRAARS